MQAHCLNCNSQLQPGEKFCAACGQKTDTKRLSFRQLGYDFLQLFIRTDKGVLRLLKGLTLNPGKTAVEYTEGKRKTYFNPFGFMAICIAFTVLINNRLKPYDAPPEPGPAVFARIPDQPTRDLYLLTVDRIARVQNVVNNNLSTITILISPWFAFFLWLFFRRRKRNLPEITVAYILFAAYANLLTTIFISPWLAGFRGGAAHSPILYGSMFLQTLYIAWGMKVFFGYRGTGGFIRVLAALGLIGIIGFVLVVLFYFLYVYHGAYAVFNYL